MAVVFSGESRQGYTGPAQMGKCPYQFTGNADPEWHDFFAAAWQFGKWASTHDVGGNGPNLTMHVTGDERRWCADGIMLCLTKAGWAADVYMHFVELLAVLPGGHPDGDLEVHIGSTDHRVVLRLWHD